MWAVVGLAGLGVVLTGWLPGAAAEDAAVHRGAPVLGFLVAITVLAELAERAGVFDVAALACARAARGSTWALFAPVAALGTVVTLGMSLDTTAVLLTPVVLALAQRLELPPAPFALLAVWLANTSSLLLPGANLTNLLALQREHLGAAALAARMALPEVAAVVVTVAHLGAVRRRQLAGRYAVPSDAGVQDRWLCALCAAACVALAPGLLLGAAPWAVAARCALVAVGAVAVRRRRELAWSLLPWRVVVLTEGLFLVVSALARHGLSGLLGHLAGTSALRTVLVAAGASNLLNNLPAYLALEPVVPVGSTHQLLAALIGTNAGPLVLVWGSLATLLWRERCRARGVGIGAGLVGLVALVGLGGVPLVLLASWGALALTS